MPICRLCGNSDIETIHKGTRDRKDVDVLKCSCCGLVFLSRILTNDEFYVAGDMRQDIDFTTWRNITHGDDLRRLNYFKDSIKGKSVMDFGCGNGGFLAMAKENGAAKVVGVEHDKEACGILLESGIECYQDIADAPPQETYDEVFMFHVIEHLPEPEQMLRELQKHMTADSILVIETPNANDALLSKYECQAFADFTYWSPHIYLYDENVLETVVKRAGMEVVEMQQIQRYPLANHLRWLAKGLPGGGVKDFQEFNVFSLNRPYTEILRQNKLCDTLICIARLPDENCSGDR